MKKNLILTFLIFVFIFSFGEEYKDIIGKNKDLLKEAELLFKEKKFDQAINILHDIETFFEKSGEAQEIYYMLAKSYKENKNIEKSYKYLKMYQSFFPYGKYSNEVTENILYIEDIKQKFNSVKVLDFDEKKILKKVKTLEAQKLYDMAIVNLKKLIEYNPENPVYHHELAVLYNKKESITSYNSNLSYLKKELNEYINITNSVVSAEIYYNIANLYYKMYEIEKAVEYWKKVKELSPSSTIGKVSSIYIDKFSN